MKKEKKRRKRKKTGGFPFGKMIIMLIMCMLVAAAGVAGYTIVMAPQISTLDAMPKGYRTSVLDDSGNVVLTLTGESSNRVYVKSEEIPQDLKDAIVAIEDERFYEHNGIDIKGIGRAFFKGITTGSFSEGASTITQQLLKNNVFTDWTEEKSFLDRIERKLQEQYLAVALEQKVEKEWILENYLNTINLGAGCWGVETAAKYYFDKDVSELTLAESATLAAITKNPTKFNPRENPEKNQERQQQVLAKMFQQGYITDQEMTAAMSEDVYTLIAQVTAGGAAQEIMTYFEDAMVYQILDDLQKNTGCTEEEAWNQIYKGGLTIYSTESTVLQNLCQEKANDTDILTTDAEISLVIIDNATGQVKAMVGGRGEKSASLIMNRAISAKRQPGSTIKILAEYAAGMENGDFSLATTYDDANYAYSDGTPIQNADGGYGGKTTVQKAIVSSDNIVALQCFQKTGMDVIWNQLQKFGISTLTDADKVEALALGGTSGGVTNLEMTAAYSAIARGGMYIEPVYYTKILDHDGNVLLEKTPVTGQAVSIGVAGELTAAMEKVVSEGTGTNAYFSSMPVAGKSGTTNDNIDAWFFGFSPYYTCGVWGGYDTNQPQESGTYVQLMWKTIMMGANDSLPDAEFTSTSELTKCTVCSKCGKKAISGLCDNTLQGDMTEVVYLPEDMVPDEKCDCHEEVKICNETGERANEDCPDTSIAVYLKTGTAGTDDEAYVLPESLKNGTCQTHNSLWDRLMNRNGEEEKDNEKNEREDNANGSEEGYGSGNSSGNNSRNNDNSGGGPDDSGGGRWYDQFFEFF